MNPIVDGIMITLFVLFMIFIFRGYHHQKYIQREAEAKKTEENKESTSQDDDSTQLQ